jgi:hypothetical protein
MAGIVIKAISGLFVWMVLPQLFFKKKKEKKIHPSGLLLLYAQLSEY